MLNFKYLLCCLYKKLQGSESLLPINYESFSYFTCIAPLLLKYDSSHEVRQYSVVLFPVENA